MLWIARLVRDQKGATAVEYGLICALIIVACVGAIGALGGSTGGLWGLISGNVQNAM